MAVGRALAMAMVLVTGACSTGDDSPSGGDTAPDESLDLGAAGGDGYGSFAGLLNTVAVVSGVVVEQRGPRSVLNEVGGVSYEGRSEDSAEWSTPWGLPVLVLEDVVNAEAISDPADLAIEELTAAIESGRVEVLVPVGVYETGTTYQFWLQRAPGGGFMSHMAFDDEQPVAGLGHPGLEQELARLSEVTGVPAQASLVLLARELSSELNGGERGELTAELLGPVELSSDAAGPHSVGD